MTITVLEDEDASGGYAFLDLGRKITRSEPKISIRRLNAEPRHLGLEGWQFEPAWLEPEASAEHADATVLRLGPQIVDQIEELVRVEISIEGEGTIGQLTWPDITPSPQSILGISLEANAPHKKPPQLVEAAPPAEAVKPFEPDPDIMAGIAEAVFTAPVAKTRARAPEPRPKRWPLLALALLILIACAIGAVALWKPELLRVASGGVAAPVPQPTPRAPTPPGPSPAGPTLQDMRRRYSDLLAAGGTAGAFLDLGRDALRAGHGQVAFRAFEEANPSANEEAAWQIAHFYDPRNDDAAYRAIASPDAARAARYFATWKARSARHATALTELCAFSAAELTTNRQLAAICRG